MDERITIDRDRGKEVARLLWSSFSSTGIFGRSEMPEDIIPEGMIRGSLEHLLFITLTVSIDYQRDANKLWRSARQSWEDSETRFLFEPRELHENPPRIIEEKMRRRGLSKKPKKDAHIWRTVGVTFYKKWEGNPQNFLADCSWEAPKVLSRLKSDNHLYRAEPVNDYPYLRGDKIGPLWLRMLRDNVGLTSLSRLNEVPIPVDIHIARATLATGVVKGNFSGPVADIFKEIRVAWFQSAKGLELPDREMIALDVDEPLWHLSKYGCTKRNGESGFCPRRNQCVAKEYCVKGTIQITDSLVHLAT